MNMPVLKTETAVSFPTASAGQGAGDRTEAERRSRHAALARAKAVASNVVPPVVVLAIVLG